MKKHSYFLYPLVLLSLVVILSGCGRGIRPPRHARYIVKSMEVTGYDSGPVSCGWKRNWYGMPIHASGPNKGKRKKVGITASGARARPGTVAADTRYYPFGTVVYVPGYGYGRVEDRGSAIKGDRLDLFFTSRKKALAWGRQTKKVKIWIPKK